MPATRRPDDPNRRGYKSRNFIDKQLHNVERTRLTADAFQEIWRHYDKNGTGYLEKQEIGLFLKDFLNSAAVGNGQVNAGVTDDEARQLRSVFLEEFDTNQDGRISLKEMTTILPLEENFYVLFRSESARRQKKPDYIKIWKKYDKDCSGYIEIDELKTFLRDMIQSGNPNQPVNEQRLDDYSEMLMQAYDTNKDGSIGLSELAKLLPPEENFVQRIVNQAMSLKKLSSADVQSMMDHYDKDNSGTLESSELANLAKDILIITQTDGYFDASDVHELVQGFLMGCDLNGDGRIDRKELALIIGAAMDATAQNGINSTTRKGPQTSADNLSSQVQQARKEQHNASYGRMPDVLDGNNKPQPNLKK